MCLAKIKQKSKNLKTFFLYCVQCSLFNLQNWILYIYVVFFMNCFDCIVYDRFFYVQTTMMGGMRIGFFLIIFHPTWKNPIFKYHVYILFEYLVFHHSLFFQNPTSKCLCLFVVKCLHWMSYVDLEYRVFVHDLNMKFWVPGEYIYISTEFRIYLEKNHNHIITTIKRSHLKCVWAPNNTSAYKHKIPNQI